MVAGPKTTYFARGTATLRLTTVDPPINKTYCINH